MLRAVIVLVEPADEGILAVFRCNGALILRNGSTVGNRPCSLCLGATVQIVLRQIGLDGVGLGRPLGIERHVGSGHCRRSPVDLRTGIAASGRVPTGELIRALFQLCRIGRRELVVVTQRCFVLHAGFLTIHITIVVVELQFVAVAGVVEVVIFLHTHFTVLGEGRFGIALREAGNGMKFLFVR